MSESINQTQKFIHQRHEEPSPYDIAAKWRFDLLGISDPKPFPRSGPYLPSGSIRRQGVPKLTLVPDVITSPPSSTVSSSPIVVGPRWETETRKRIEKLIERYQRPIAELVQRKANEGDTRLLVTDILCDLLGFDKYEDLTTEFRVQGDFADYGVSIESQLIAFVEVKRCSIKLNEKHLSQIQVYAANQGVEWMILTNGQQWKIYHLAEGFPVKTEKVIEIDLLDMSTTLTEKIDAFLLISKESFMRRKLHNYWQRKSALSGKNISEVILSEEVLDLIRKKIARLTGQKFDNEEIGQRIVEEVFVKNRS